MHIEVYRRRVFYRVRLVGGNGETMLTSETYYSKGNAQRAARHLSVELDIRYKED